MSSPYMGIYVGIFVGGCRGCKEPCQFSGRAKSIPGSRNAVPWLDQMQLNRPFYGCPAVIDIEFAVDALGMGADRT